MCDDAADTDSGAASGSDNAHPVKDNSSGTKDAADNTKDAADNTKDAADNTKDAAGNTKDAAGNTKDAAQDCSSNTPADRASGRADAEESDDDGVMENLLSFMKDKLKIGNEDKTPKIPSILPTADVAGVVEYISSGNCRNIITMAGAGISTSAGIPDFRSEGSGLYHNLQKYNLPHPQAIFELDFFRKNPQPFFTLAKELYPGSFDPTPSHYFIKLLQQKGLLLRHYTQNIDTLEHVAGIREDKLIEAHGSFRTAHCLDCRELYHQDWVKDELFADRVPTCTKCAGVVKPDIVFFGEGLPNRFFQGVQSDFPKCDLLIIMGTSLTVQPFASLIDNVSATCPRLLLNRESVGQDASVLSSLQQLMGRSSGLRLNCPKNKRDVAILADCDEACRTLADKLGWQDELESLIKEGKKKDGAGV